MLGTITIGNIKRTKEGIYIGRYNPNIDLPASPLGNPFKRTEPDALKKYKQFLWQQIKLKNNVFRELIRIKDLVMSGKDVTLLCWCKEPGQDNPCHGDVIKAAIIWLIKDEKSISAQIDIPLADWFLREHKAGRLDVTPNLHLSEHVVIGNPARWYEGISREIDAWVNVGHHEYASIGRINFELKFIEDYHFNRNRPAQKTS